MNEPTLPQQEIRRRLLALMETAAARTTGRNRQSTDLRVTDVARYIGRDTVAVTRMARGADMPAQDQLRMSKMLIAFERGDLVKTISTNGKAVLDWKKPTQQPPVERRGHTLGIELTPTGPRFKRTPVA
jgi:hypothetical protein